MPNHPSWLRSLLQDGTSKGEKEGTLIEYTCKRGLANVTPDAEAAAPHPHCVSAGVGGGGGTLENGINPHCVQLKPPRSSPMGVWGEICIVKRREKATQE